MDDNKTQSVAYDGRQLTIITINKLMESAIENYINNDQYTCLKIYLSILNIVKKNIGTDKYNEIKKTYQKCISLLSNYNNNKSQERLMGLDINISKLQEDILYNINHIILPTKDTEDITEWNDEEFLEGSDL